MDVNNFLGSFADENVTFRTRIIKTTKVGDQYWKVMVFVENDRFVDLTQLGWEAVPNVATAKALSVSSTDYAEYTTGLLRSWLYDLFATGFTGDCILVACCDKADNAAARVPKLTSAYDQMKMYAYFKSACLIKSDYEGDAGDAVATDLDTASIVELAKLCGTDKEFISSAPFLPYATSTPETPSSDLLYATLLAAKADAVMSCYADKTRNAALYALGLALSQTNGSQTPVGNSFDMWKTNSIASSGPNGEGLARAIRKSLGDINIQTWKPVGDNSAYVAAEGANTLNGDTIAANWCVAYITYMSKVAIARLITEPNFFRNNYNYTRIVSAMVTQINNLTASGRLVVTTSVPPFDSLPQSSDEITIDDAWTGYYQDTVRKVAISGRLYIGTEV